MWEGKRERHGQWTFAKCQMFIIILLPLLQKPYLVKMFLKEGGAKNAILKHVLWMTPTSISLIILRNFHRVSVISLHNS